MWKGRKNKTVVPHERVHSLDFVWWDDRLSKFKARTAGLGISQPYYIDERRDMSSFDMQAAGHGEYSRSLVVRLRSAESIDSHRALATRKDKGRNLQNGQGYDNKHTIRAEFESVRNTVEEKLTDDSLLRTWDGSIRKCELPDRKFVGSLH
jgi:hypothetical protein